MGAQVSHSHLTVWTWVSRFNGVFFLTLEQNRTEQSAARQLMHGQGCEAYTHLAKLNWAIMRHLHIQRKSEYAISRWPHHEIHSNCSWGDRGVVSSHVLALGATVVLCYNREVNCEDEDRHFSFIHLISPNGWFIHEGTLMSITCY
jgi:hypothetical protein